LHGKVALRGRIRRSPEQKYPRAAKKSKSPPTPFFGVSAGSVSLRLVFDLRQCPLTRHPEGKAVMTMCQCAGHEKVSCSQTQDYTDRLKESRAFLPSVATARRSCPQECA